MRERALTAAQAGAGTTAQGTATEALEEPTEAATETPMAEETSEITGTTADRRRWASIAVNTSRGPVGVSVT